MISTVIMLIATQFPGPDPPIPAPARAHMFVLSQVRCYTTPGTGLTRVGSTGAACPAPGPPPFQHIAGRLSQSAPFWTTVT